MTTLKSSFSPYPTDVLKSVMLKLPFKEILNLCKTQYSVKDICNNPNFWADKTQLDFGVSTPIFHKRFNEMHVSPAEIYASYLEVYMMTKFLMEIFELGAILLGWVKGRGVGYSKIYNRIPIGKFVFYKSRNIIDYGINKPIVGGEIIVNERILRITNLYNNSSPQTKQLIQNLTLLDVFKPYKTTLVDKRGETINSIYEILKTKKPKPEYSMTEINNTIFIYKPTEINLIQYVSSLLNTKNILGRKLIGTAIIYLSRYGKIIENFDLDLSPVSWMYYAEEELFTDK